MARATHGVVLSGFCDEISASKCFAEQLSVASALGLSHIALRFLDVGSGPKNAIRLAKQEVELAIQMLADHGLLVSTLGSPLGKIKLVDRDDGTATPFVGIEQQLRQDVPRACELARGFGTRLIRGFTFYPPRQADPRDYFAQALDHVGRIADVCLQFDCILGLEVEANLIGRSGRLLAEFSEQLGHPSVVLVFDAGNLVMQGYTEDHVFAEYLAMKPRLGWLHVKDYVQATRGGEPDGYVNESQAQGFVPAGMGNGAYRRVFQDLAGGLSAVRDRLRPLGIPDLIIELEPHLRAGGQFGGFSGPDGFGLALRTLGSLLADCGMPYRLLDWPAFQARTRVEPV